MAAHTTFEQQCRRADPDTALLYRPWGQNAAARAQKKAMTRTSWYRPYGAVVFLTPTPSHGLRDRLWAAMSEEAARIGVSINDRN